MESVRDPNVDPPDHCQVWEAPSHTSSTAGPLTPPSFPQPGESRRYFRWLANQLNSLVGWLVFDNCFGIEARWFTRIYNDPVGNNQRSRIKFILSCSERGLTNPLSRHHFVVEPWMFGRQLPSPASPAHSLFKSPPALLSHTCR